MATLEQKIEVEQRVREMLEESDVRQPDWVEYGFTCIRLFWEEPKVVLVVDIDEPPEGFDLEGSLGDLAGLASQLSPARNGEVTDEEEVMDQADDW